MATKGDFVKIINGEFKGEIGLILGTRKALLNKHIVSIEGTSVNVNLSHNDFELVR